MHRKGAQDAKRAKVFTKLIRELTVASRAGLPDPEKNPRLRSAVTAAARRQRAKGHDRAGRSSAAAARPRIRPTRKCATRHMGPAGSP